MEACSTGTYARHRGALRTGIFLANLTASFEIWEGNSIDMHTSQNS